MTKAVREEITLSRVFDAPPELVYLAFVAGWESSFTRLDSLLRRSL